MLNDPLSLFENSTINGTLGQRTLPMFGFKLSLTKLKQLLELSKVIRLTVQLPVIEIVVEVSLKISQTDRKALESSRAKV